jgi:uncharacterized protein (TIGR00369 family)
MKVTDIGEDFLTMSMPVNSKVQQPFGVVHGGAVAALAENVASMAGNLLVEKGKVCVGLVLSSNHLKSVSNGTIYATAKPIHVGRSTQVWEVRTVSDQGVFINLSKLTLAVIDKK